MKINHALRVQWGTTELEHDDPSLTELEFVEPVCYEQAKSVYLRWVSD